MAALPPILLGYFGADLQLGVYFIVPLIGSLLLFLATLLIGRSALGGDLRAILIYALIFEILMYFCYSFSKNETKWLYQYLYPHYKPIEYALWMVLIFRMYWPMAGLSYPRFDFFRDYFNESSDHKKLTTEMKILGYFMLIFSFLLGYLFGFYDLTLNSGPLIAIPGILLLSHWKKEEAEIADLQD